MRRLVIMLIILSCVGCSGNAHVRNISADLPYPALFKQLSASDDLEYGWPEVRVTATLLHKVLSKYRMDLPNKGTGIEFFLSSFVEKFDIERMMFTLSTDNGTSIVMTGLGTDKPAINGKISSDQIVFIPLGKNGGRNRDSLTRFIVVFPMELKDDVKLLSLQINDMSVPRASVKFRWRFNEG